MDGPEYWEEIGSGESGGLILAIDMLSGENMADFRELVPLLDTPHNVWRALEKFDSPLKGDSLAAFIEPWLDAVRASGLRVRAVLGRRVGAILACAIAEALGRTGQRAPRVLLFDPELVDIETVVGEFRRAIADAPYLLDEPDVISLERDLGSSPEQRLDDPAALATRISWALLGTGRAAGPNAAAGATTASLNRAVNRLRVLALAELYDVIPLWSECTALSSSSPGKGLTRTRAALLMPEAGFVAREICLKDDETGMLTSPAVAHMASDLLAAMESEDAGLSEPVA
ncbi:hypothetical protein ACWGI8_42440 [Streptomyces sp. NPDC054841]